MSEERLKPLKPRKPVECRPVLTDLKIHSKGRPTKYYDALPRDFEFAYNTASYYVTGFRIFDVYKTKVDFSEFRKLIFIEDPDLVEKWGLLRSRIPYAQGRITDLPGTRDLHYHNYCLRNMTAETAKSWRKSIKKDFEAYVYPDKEIDESSLECVCNE